MKKKKIVPERKKEIDFWRFFVLISVSVFLFLRFFADGLSYPGFNFFWNVYFFLLVVIQLARERLKKKFFKEEFVIFLFFLFSVISSGLSPVKGAGIMYNSQILAYICFFSLIIHNLKPSGVKVLYYALLGSALCITLYGLHQYFWGLESTRQLVHSNPDLLRNLPPTFLSRLESKRIFATFVYPNIYASFLLFIIPVSFFMFVSDEKKIIRFSSLAVLILAFYNLLLMGSLGGILICLFSALLMLLFVLIKDRKKLGIVVLCLVFLQIAAIFAVYGAGRLPKISSLEDRIGYWQAAVRIFRESPFLGAGPGNYMHNYTRFKRPESMEAKHAHSIFFETLAETGIMGTLLLFSFLVMLLLLFFKREKSPPLLSGAGFAFLAFFLHNMMDFNFINPAVAILFFLAGATAVVLRSGEPVAVDSRLTKCLNCLIIVTVLLVASNYARYTVAEKNILLSQESKSSVSRLFYIDRAIKVFHENFEVHEKKGDLYFNEGMMQKDRMHYERAVNNYLRALALNPYSSRVYRKMAFLCQEKGDMACAERMHLKVLEIYPSKKQYNLEAAIFFMKQGKGEKAEYYYEKSKLLTAATIEEAHLDAAYIKWIESQK